MHIERLEHRVLFRASIVSDLVDSTLYIYGTADDDSMRLSEKRGYIIVNDRSEVTAKYQLDKVTRLVVFGGGGNDYVKVSGFSVPSLIMGGEGKDTVKSNSADDTLIGGNGKDKLDGGGGNDLIYGDAGRDALEGGSGDDFLDPGSTDEQDKVRGNSGIDTVASSFSDDRVSEVEVTVPSGTPAPFGAIPAAVTSSVLSAPVVKDGDKTRLNLSFLFSDELQETFFNRGQADGRKIDIYLGVLRSVASTPVGPAQVNKSYDLGKLGSGDYRLRIFSQDGLISERTITKNTNDIVV